MIYHKSKKFVSSHISHITLAYAEVEISKQAEHNILEREKERIEGMENLIIKVAKFVVFTAFMVMPHQMTTKVRADEPEREEGEPEPWAKTVGYGKERTTLLQFYYHDVVVGENATVLQVVPPSQPGSTHPFTGFGFIRMSDDPLTVGPDPKSKLVGRAQGLYGRAAQAEYSLIMALTFAFSDGIYNGSSFSVLTRNAIAEPVREFPVIGGTGVFRMARGYVLARTYFLDVVTRNAIVGYNVTLLHH